MSVNSRAGVLGHQSGGWIWAEYSERIRRKPEGNKNGHEKHGNAGDREEGADRNQHIARTYGALPDKIWAFSAARDLMTGSVDFSANSA